MSYGTIKLIFVKEGCKDDVLKIVPSDSSNSYDVELRQNTINNVAYRNIVQRGLYKYLERVLRSVVLDEEGPQQVQIDVPTFPTVMVNTEDVLDYLSLLKEQIASIEDDWPFEQTVSSLQSVKPTNTAFNVTYNSEPFVTRTNHTFYNYE